jgi:erythronate-4-phosphate dehydrogenase
MKIVADAHVPFVHEYFDECCDLVLIPGRRITHADVKDADILLVRSVTLVNEKLLANTKVKFVGSVTAGADHLDTKWLNDANIAWSIATGFNAPPVADYVVAVIAALASEDANFRNKKDRSRLKAAVIGVGNVGSQVFNKLKLLNFDVVLCDPIKAESDQQFSSMPMDAISDVDLISLHVPLTKTGTYPTYHFIDKTFLTKQKPGCVLLNASRGAVIDFGDLIKYGAHLKWCFDVWEHEPFIDKQILKEAQIATPHIAGYSVQSKVRGIHMIYRIICEKKLIQPQSVPPIFMQDQTLKLAGNSLKWYDIVLAIFNPLMISTKMREALLPAKELGPLFDEMRHQFNERYEFSYTKVEAKTLSDDAKTLLTKLGMKMIAK